LIENILICSDVVTGKIEAGAVGNTRGGLGGLN